MSQVHCQGVVVHLQTVTLLGQLGNYLLQLLRLRLLAAQVLDAVVLDGDSALEDAVVVLQLCKLSLDAILQSTALQLDTITAKRKYQDAVYFKMCIASNG